MVKIIGPFHRLSFHPAPDPDKQKLMKDQMLRQIMSNEWTAAMFGIVLLAAHVIWFLGSRHQAEVISGLGGAVTVLGILVAAQPYIRKGVRQAGREQAGLENPIADRRQRDREHEAAEAEGVRHVLKERVVGVALVGGGSLLNAYGPAIATALHLKGC